MTSSATQTGSLLAAVRGGVDLYDLGRRLSVGMPQSPNHPAFWHALPRRHGDMVRADGGSAANDLITMGTHVGTHIDAFTHVSHDGRLLDGSNAHEAGRGGRLVEFGAHTIPPCLRRCVLLAGIANAARPVASVAAEDVALAPDRRQRPHRGHRSRRTLETERG